MYLLQDETLSLADTRQKYKYLKNTLVRRVPDAIDPNRGVAYTTGTEEEFVERSMEEDVWALLSLLPPFII